MPKARQITRSIGKVYATKFVAWSNCRILTTPCIIWQPSTCQHFHQHSYLQCHPLSKKLISLVGMTNVIRWKTRWYLDASFNKQLVDNSLGKCRHLISRCYCSKGTCNDNGFQPAPPHISCKTSPRTIYDSDEFEWMMDPAYSKEFERYIEQENRFTEESLGKSVTFQKKLISQMRHYDMRHHHIDPFHIKNDNYEYWRELQKDGCFVYYRKSLGKDHSEECILDTAELLKKYNYPMNSAVSDIKVSACQQYAACMVENFAPNTDTYSTHVIRMTRSGAEHVDIIPVTLRFEFGHCGTIFYTQPNSEESLRAGQVWRHVIGQSKCQDSLVYEEHDDRLFVDLYPTQDGRFISIIASTMQTLSEVWLIDATNNSARTAKPRLVWPRQDGLEYFVEHKEGHLYILASFGEGWQVYKVPLEHTPCSPTSATEGLFSRKFDNVCGFEVMHDSCVVSVVSWPEGIRLAVKTSKNSGKNHQEIKLGTQFCSINHIHTSNSKSGSFYFRASSPIQPPVYYSYESDALTLSRLPGQEGMCDGSRKYACVRTHSVSKDGTHVPITIFHRRDLKLDRSNPMLASVYGAYGSDIEMDYSPERIPLLQQGWVLAFCHVRGGGELGRTWSQNGRQLKKKHTFEDFHSCISHLHNKKYSQPNLTAAYGISAGGLTVAVLCNESPHLIKGAVLKVPFVDVLQTMLDPTLPLTIQDYDEYGDPKDQVIFSAIQQYCPYYNIKNQHYPSMYVITSLTDRRVPPWGPVRYVAKLRRIMQGDKGSHKDGSTQILLQVDQEGGHFGSVDSEANWAQAAKEWAFLYKAMDLPFSRRY